MNFVCSDRLLNEEDCRETCTYEACMADCELTGKGCSDTGILETRCEFECNVGLNKLFDCDTECVTGDIRELRCAFDCARA